MSVIKHSSLFKGIYLSIKLGNPRYECARFGICEMDADGDFYLHSLEKMDKRARAIVTVTKKKQLNFLFDRSSLTDKTDKEHFSSGFFTMEVPKELPTALSDKLGMGLCQIEAGVYAISAYKQQYKIVMAIHLLQAFIRLIVVAQNKPSTEGQPFFELSKATFLHRSSQKVPSETAM
jgi:hypothetical protein